MQTLRRVILIGWPEKRYSVPVSIRLLELQRGPVVTQWNTLQKRPHHCAEIPEAEVITRLHSSHQGIESCLRKAQDRVYWPAMNADIKEAVTKSTEQHTRKLARNHSTCGLFGPHHPSQACASKDSKNIKAPSQVH